MEGIIFKYQRLSIDPLKLHQHDNCYLKGVSIFLSFYQAIPNTMAPWCCGYHYTSAQLHSTKSKLKFYAGSNPASDVSVICDCNNL